MKNWKVLTVSALLATSLAACSSDDDDDEPRFDGGSGTDDGSGLVTDDGGEDGSATAAGVTTGGETLPGGGTGGGDDAGTGTGTTPTTTGGDTGTGTSGTTGGTTGGTTQITPTDGDGQGLPQVANPVATTQDDPFGFTLEADRLVPAGDGIPTQPQNLRIDLVSRDWAEFNWANSVDGDGEIAAYVIERSDGQTYTLTPALEPGLALDPGTYVEYEKYWNTTSFIDCNSTRFGFVPGSEKAADAPWNCADARPEPGTTYTYTVTAEDDEGNRSAPSEPLTIAYLSEDPTERSNVADFLDDFALVWSDEFDGTAVDGDRWNSSLRGGSSTFINGEQQYFVDTLDSPSVDYDPFSFDGEGLTITAVRTPPELVPGLPEGCFETDPVLANDPTRQRCEFLSGALSSHDRMQFVYGYVEGRIKASAVPGALSSFYLLNRYPGGNDEENGVYQLHAPEIDILEYLGENPFGDEDAFQTYHYYDVFYGGGPNERSSPTMNHENEDGTLYADDFHTFGVLWEPQLVIWYIDGVEVRRLTGPQIARQPMNIVNYLVAGSGWAPEPAENGPPLEMDVDYIRVYQREQFQGTLLCGNPGDPSPCPAPSVEE